LQACVLAVNAAAILNNDRFLERHGWGFSQLGGGAAGTHSPGALKQQIIGALHATQYLRVPLVVVNVIIILVKLLFG
ncbi:Immediate early response 3-interacting protein 1, partial [Auxenochlorella protothecoides]